jgi:type VI secretion system protein VasJ
VPVEFEQLRERAKEWVEPIPGKAPAGAAAKFDQKYQAVANEVAKVDMPAGGEVDWKAVAERAGELLRTKTKDLAIASYLAHALQRTRGLDGLASGVTLLAELIDRYWDGMFPEVKRIRGRVNALQWFLEKTGMLLSQAQVTTADLAKIEALDAAGKKLAEVVRARFADQAPAMNPLLEQVERLRLSAEPPPAPEAPPAPAAQAPAAEAPGGAPAAAALPAAPAGTLASAEDAAAYLGGIGDALVGAARVLRQADAKNPTCYRLLRVGLWLQFSGPPPAAAGKTQIAPPPEDLRNQLNLLQQNQKWNALLEEAESAVENHRFALDIHRLSWQALSGLGTAHEKARDALGSEMRSLLSRMPPLQNFSFADGTPLADPQTKSWIEDQILPQGGPGLRRGAGGDGDAAAARMAEAKKLLGASQVPEALALLQQGVMTARGGRDRFLARLELARLAAGSGLVALAKATYDELAREAAENGIDAWEPELVAECLKGLITSARSLPDDPRGASKDLVDPYKRLCCLDPVAAQEVWP